MAKVSAGPLGEAPMSDDIDLAESVAGEEDPGASIDLAAAAAAPGRSDQPAGKRSDQPSGGQAAMSPGDEAPAGTPGTGEDVCPNCGGSGRAASGACPMCGGTGKVIVGIGGA
jgi:DnaJ-class molecular chaperone